ncbi:T9SS type A sorting domain-containing protein [Hanstruepera neustonica]|nr:T9SS type A sorting domain-containing protein [Hanstruepera neustonica]
MHLFRYLGLALLLLVTQLGYAQEHPFEITLEPVSITNLGGIQSFAYGQHDGKWLIVGGRLDGLHRRQPWAAFDIAGHNNQLIVVDPVAEQRWSAPLTSLPTGIQEQLSATNMEFYQQGEYLYCFGGYGYSNTEADHTTYPNLTAIHVPDVINAVINNTDLTSHFRQISDTEFQVTGGRIQKIGDTFYLLGGQKFIGRYNPMGPDHGPGFIQEYTNAIRKFQLADDGTTITVTHLTPHEDAANLHRRDYNAEVQILPNGEEGITMFSGVFQEAVDLPFLNSVTVDATGYTVNNVFEQHYNHYHCAVLPLYSETENDMHTVFFGGMAQFYDDNGTMVQDDNVPFVNTIARVTRNADGVMGEYKLPVEMPGLLGSGAEFIPNTSFPQFNNGVFKYDDLTEDYTLIGHIFGGINSTQPNIFFINDGTQSDASNTIYKVLIKKTNALSVDEFNTNSANALNLSIYPNPSDGSVHMTFTMRETGDMSISIYDIKGALIEQVVLKDLATGAHTYTKDLSHLGNNQVYLIILETDTEKVTQKLILKK